VVRNTEEKWREEAAIIQRLFPYRQCEKRRDEKVWGYLPALPL
jgi:hypothetical protein